MNRENTVKKKDITRGSATAAKQKAVKNRDSDHLQQDKKQSNYTIKRNQDDIKKIEKVRKHLKNECGPNSFNTDAEIYRELPYLYLNAVRTITDQDLVIAELQSKVAILDRARGLFCSLFEILHGEYK